MNRCEADPDALAKYVMALIKKDKPEDELRKICLDQLDVFLQKHTTSFVDLFFKSLKDKSYLKPPVESVSLTSTQLTSAPLISSGTSSTTNNTISTVSQSSSGSNCKIVTQEKADSSESRTDQNSKQQYVSRRGTRKSRSRSPRTSPSRLRTRDGDIRRDEGRYGRRRPDVDRSRDGRKRSRSRGSRSPVRGSRVRRSRSRSLERPTDASGNSRKHRGRSATPPPQLEPQDEQQEKPQQPSNSSKKQRCRDFDGKGYCLRGDHCPFDHGTDPVIMDPALGAGVFGGLASNSVPVAPPLLPTPAPSTSWPEPYNPEAPGLNPAPLNPVLTAPPPNRPLMPHAPFGWPTPRPPFGAPGVNPGNPGRVLVSVVSNVAGPNGSGDGDMTGLNNNNQQYPRSRFPPGKLGKKPWHKGPRFPNMNRDEPEKCTLEVRKIPPHLNTITQLNDHFSKFGRIENLQVNFGGDREAALIQFSTHSEAQAAHRSPDAVLGNRFIKVFWHSKERQEADPPVDKGAPLPDVGSENQSADASSAEPKRKLSIKERLGPVDMTSDFKVKVGGEKRVVLNPKDFKKSNTKIQVSAAEPVAVPMTLLKSEVKREKFLKHMELKKKTEEKLDSCRSDTQKIYEKIIDPKITKEEKQQMMTMFDILEKNRKQLEEDLKRINEQLLIEKRKGGPKRSGLRPTGFPHVPKIPKVITERTEKKILELELDALNTIHGNSDPTVPAGDNSTTP